MTLQATVNSLMSVIFFLLTAMFFFFDENEVLDDSDVLAHGDVFGEKYIF